MHRDKLVLKQLDYPIHSARETRLLGFSTVMRLPVRVIVFALEVK